MSGMYGEEETQFTEDLHKLIKWYEGKITTATTIGILKMMADQLSDDARNEPGLRGPHPLS